MIYFPMMRMTKDKEVSALVTTLLVCFCSENVEMHFTKMLASPVYCNTAGVVNASARTRNPIIDINSVH